MPVSGEDIERVAGPARLKLTSEELKNLAQDLARVIGYINLIQKVGIGSILPQSHLIESGPILSEDPATASFSGEKALSNAPGSDEGCFKTPRVIDK